EPPGLDAAQHVRHAIVLVDVQDVERHAHEPHVNPAAGLEHQAAPGGQLAAAHESPEARPERCRQLGAVGQNLIAAAVDYSNAAHHDSYVKIWNVSPSGLGSVSVSLKCCAMARSASAGKRL